VNIETGIQRVLDQRGERYGDFRDQAILSQQLKRTMRQHVAYHGKSLDPYQMESLEMILHKVARIVNGDPNYLDSWVDIEGYARLVSERLTR